MHVICDYPSTSNSYSFWCKKNDKWRGDSCVRVSFENITEPLFANMEYDDEFEIEITLKRTPKSKPEVKIFK